MKSKFSLLGIFAALVIGITTIFIGCKKEDVNAVVKYYGKVVYVNTSTPFPDLEVKVTDGENTHCQGHTDAEGKFSLSVKVDEINGNYYVLVGDSTCEPKKVALPGFGQPEIDLGTIEIEGPSLPVVSTKAVKEIRADAAVTGGNVTSDGRLTVTARGVCYGKEAYPTIDGLHTTDGTGKGEFTSNLKELEYNTVYYARAYATNKMGTAYGEQVKFITAEGVAVVITDSVYNITANSAKCKAHVVSDGGFSVTKRGVCWSTKADPTIDDKITEEGSGLGEYINTLKDLVEDTKYYVRAYATNSTITSYGEQIIITTLDGLPKVTTDSVGSITANSFTCYGNVLADCDIPVSARGFVYSTKQYPTIDDSDYTTSGKGLSTFKNVVSKLEYGTTYYIRAYATNATATVYGEQLVVTTLDGLPKVTTAKVTNIGSVKATCGGNVTDDGTLTVTARGVCYGTTQQPTIDGAHTTDGKGKGEFTSSIKDLKDKTTYYVRAYATTDAGTAYGEQRTFKTENGVPVVELTQVGNPTANSVTCTGNVTGDGGVEVTERGFCYSTSQYPTNTDAHVAVGNGIGEFNGSLTGLTINTTYYIRAYAVNSLGVGYSEQQKFTTLDGMAVVSTAQPTATATTIAAGGEITDNGGYAVTERGVCYSATNSEPTITDGKVTGGKGNGTFNVSITGLAAATTYYVRAYAINENGTAYGEARIVTTINGVATVTVGAIKNITALTASGSVTVTAAGGATLQTCGICWATTPNPTIDNDKVVGGNQLNTAYTCNMSELTPNTTYYVRAYATTDIATAYSEQVTFKTTTGLPVVTTGNATATATSITATGEVTSNGGYAVTERGFCYSKTNAEPSVTDTKIISGSGNGSFNASISALSVATTYYVRAYATNTNGTSYGQVITITTKNGVATVTAGAIKNVTALTASGSVTVTDAGGATLQSCGICWATTPNPTIDNNKVTGGNQLNTAYTCNMSELTPNTTYYVRAYATTDIATAYSEQVTFKTTTGLPVVTTGNATATATSVTATGEVTDNGGYNVTERGICYSKTNAEPSLTDSKMANGSGNGSFSVSISNLTASTTYYIRAYATNSIGTSYGKTVTVTTKNGVATVTAGAIKNITALTASGSVTVTDAGGATLQSCGICWATTPNPTTANSKTVASGKQLNATYNCNMTALSPNTTYYVRAYATTNIATAYSNQITFTTTTGLPIVTTANTTATSVAITSGGTVTGDGGYSITARGVCYSTTNSIPTLSDKYVSNGTGKGSYSCTITGVSVSTTYYVRAYATNSIGTTYGDAITVMTGNGLPTVATTPVGENVTNTTAVGGGQVIDDGGYSVTARGVCWSTNPLPTTYDNKTTNGSGIGYFSSNITGIDLTGSNVYYVRAYATNTNGTTYGNAVKISKENLEYANLPKVTYGGYTYRLYPDMGTMTGYGAISACENLNYGGYDDWYMPTLEELPNLIKLNPSGWMFDGTKNTFGEYITTYWSSTSYDEMNDMYYYVLITLDPNTKNLDVKTANQYRDYADDKQHRVRAVRKYVEN